MFKWDVSIHRVVPEAGHDVIDDEAEELRGVNLELDGNKLRALRGGKVIAEMEASLTSLTIDAEKITLRGSKRPAHTDFSKLFPDRFYWERRPHRMEEIVRTLWGLE